MLFNELQKEIHENAVNHGWWETKRPIEETCALIHSEWSEALEEYRAGRSAVWEGEHGKPEGIAVELIDGVIRIMDLFGAHNMNILGRHYNDLKAECAYSKPEELPQFIAFLHALTTYSLWTQPPTASELNIRVYYHALYDIIAYVNQYIISAYKLDPQVILVDKHQYNTTRPYKHGKVC